MATVGLLHPGEMGAAVGGCLVTNGHTVLWDQAGRSRATTGRALAAELTGTGLDDLVSRSSVIFGLPCVSSLVISPVAIFSPSSVK